MSTKKATRTRRAEREKERQDHRSLAALARDCHERLVAAAMLEARP